MSDAALMRRLLAEPGNRPILTVLNDVLGGPIEDPHFAVWRAVDADAIRRLGLVDGAIDSGLYWTEAQYNELASRLGALTPDEADGEQQTGSAAAFGPVGAVPVSGQANGDGDHADVVRTDGSFLGPQHKIRHLGEADRVAFDGVLGSVMGTAHDRGGDAHGFSVPLTPPVTSTPDEVDGAQP